MSLTGIIDEDIDFVVLLMNSGSEVSDGLKRTQVEFFDFDRAFSGATNFGGGDFSLLQIATGNDHRAA